jgi:protein-tyrosine phosphatase
VPDRLLAFEASFNFRDLGGYPTRDGRTVRRTRLFRADTLHRLSAADVAAFGRLGLRSVVELADFGRLGADAATTVQWHHLPMIDGVVLRPDPTAPAPPAASRAPGAVYLEMLGDGAMMARVFSVLCTGLPAVFHCTSGKDRTGMVAAFALDLLGVADDVIAVDYELTNEMRARSTEWIEAHEPAFGAFLAQIPEDRRMARPETILAFLDGVRAVHGSVEELLEKRGVTPEQIQAFRTELLEG